MTAKEGIGLREYFERVLDERRQHYDTRFKAAETAVNAALAAQKELTSAAFAASEKAIQKAEANAAKWQDNANEWRGSMKDREMQFAPRLEVEGEFRALRAEISALRSSRDEGSGRRLGGQSLWGYIVAAIAATAALVTIAMKLGG